MVFTIFLALAGILIFAIWSNNDFYLYAQQSYSRSIAAPSKLTSSTENPGNTITTANTSISQQQQTRSTWSSSSVPSIQPQQWSPSNPSTQVMVDFQVWSIPKKSYLSLSMFFEACIKNFPLKYTRTSRVIVP